MDLKRDKANNIIKSYGHKLKYVKNKSPYLSWVESNIKDDHLINMRTYLMKINHNIDIALINNKDIQSDVEFINSYTPVENKMHDDAHKSDCKNARLFKNDNTGQESKTAQQITPDEKKMSDQDINNCFAWLQRIGWKDKDESTMRNNRVVSHGYDIKNIYNTMFYLSNDLYNSISKITGAIDAMNDESKYNFLFHVISKGRDMYYQSLVDPEFALYMLDQYQPLYTYMKYIS